MSTISPSVSTNFNSNIGDLNDVKVKNDVKVNYNANSINVKQNPSILGGKLSKSSFKSFTKNHIKFTRKVKISNPKINIAVTKDLNNNFEATVKEIKTASEDLQFVKNNWETWQENPKGIEGAIELLLLDTKNLKKLGIEENHTTLKELQATVRRLQTLKETPLFHANISPQASSLKTSQDLNVSIQDLKSQFEDTIKIFDPTQMDITFKNNRQIVNDAFQSAASITHFLIRNTTNLGIEKDLPELKDIAKKIEIINKKISEVEIRANDNGKVDKNIIAKAHSKEMRGKVKTLEEQIKKAIKPMATSLKQDALEIQNRLEKILKKIFISPQVSPSISPKPSFLGGDFGAPPSTVNNQTTLNLSQPRTTRVKMTNFDVVTKFTQPLEERGKTLFPTTQELKNLDKIKTRTVNRGSQFEKAFDEVSLMLNRLDKNEHPTLDDFKEGAQILHKNVDPLGDSIARSITTYIAKLKKVSTSDLKFLALIETYINKGRKHGYDISELKICTTSLMNHIQSMKSL